MTVYIDKFDFKHLRRAIVYMDKQRIDEFKNGIFALRTRRFGTVAEIMIQKLYNLAESKSLAFDKKNSNTNERIEIKFSTVMKENSDKIRSNNVIEQCINANISNRAMSSYDKCVFDCNIQQIKPKEFDTLYYGLYFSDVIEIYKVTSEKVINCPGYSDKQHRGNKGEGQFHINNDNIKYHRENNLERKLTYEELYELFCEK